MIRQLFVANIEKIRDINQKYAEPDIRMTKTVSSVLLVLRIYLLVIVCLLVYKFITLL